MLLSTFAKGLTFGIAVSAPVGPIGVLCFRKTLNEGKLSGLAIGLGAATADALCAAIAACGITLSSKIISENQLLLKTFSGFLLSIWGLRLILSHKNCVPSDIPQKKVKGFLGSAIGAFLITLTNPATIIAFTVAFTSVAVFSPMGALHLPELLIAGVFIGGASCWTIIIIIASHLKRWSPDLEKVNRISGVLLLIFGLAFLLHVAFILLTG